MQSAERREVETLIVGGGPAGLAVGAALRRANVPFVIVERGARVAESWHHHYERLHLHTPKALSALPFRPYPRDYPRYPSRAQMIAYFEDYARAFDLRPEFGVRVCRVERDGDGTWNIATEGDAVRARNVVIATGFNRVPNEPRWPGQATFPGPIVHSGRYANGEAFRGQRVLVVGFGNSGAEIALDLLEHGARPTIAVRGAVNVIPRAVLGVPITFFSLALGRLPPRVADRMNRLSLRLTIGDLRSAGLSKQAFGPFTQIATTQRIPVIDVGTLARIRRREIAVRKGIASFDGADVVFTDGTREPFDAIVLGTGFTTGLGAWLPPEVLDTEGRPLVHGHESARPGLYFCGFRLSPTGLLRQIGIEARTIAQSVERRAQRGP